MRGIEPAAQAVAPLSGADFEHIRRLARESFGLDLKAGKEQLVAARLGRLLRDGRFRSYRELYRGAAEDATGETLATLIDALATNHTAFVREPDHFDFLRDEVVPRLRKRGEAEVWCAACSTGEEVWTLACVLNDALPGNRFRITATDISRKALAVARRGVYSAERCAGMPPAWVSRYFKAENGDYSVNAAVRSQASFSRFNLLDRFSAPRPYPVIFCRNVMIYFDAETQHRVVLNLAANLEPGGYLFIGHAESLSRIAHGLEYVRPAVYRRPSKPEGVWNRLS